MTRSRIIKPEFFKHADLYDAEAASGLPLRLAFAGLWTVADRAGRFVWKPRELKLEVLPYDACDFGAVLDALERGGFVRSYVVDGKRFGVIDSFADHQTFHQREAASKLPVPPELTAGRTLPEPRPILGSSQDQPRQPVSVSVSGSVTGSGSVPNQPEPLASASTAKATATVGPIDEPYRPEPLPPTVVMLPPQAERFITEIYGMPTVTPERRADVRRQLLDAIDPTKRGAFVRRGVFVKTTPDRLDRVCLAVRMDPPQSLDAAIVMVLRKLQDAETDAAGRTVTEAAEHDTRQTDALLSRYELAARAAANAWVAEHRDEYEPIKRRLAAQFPGADTAGADGWQRVAYNAAHLSEVRKASGFPDFETWRTENARASPAKHLARVG